MMMIYNSHIFNNSYKERENENENPGMQCPIDLRKQECKASVLCAMSKRYHIAYLSPNRISEWPYQPYELNHIMLLQALIVT